MMQAVLDGRPLLDQRLSERFGFATREFLSGYRALLSAIVDLDERFIDHNPDDLNLEMWNEDLSTPRHLIDAVWERGMQVMGGQDAD